jgi:hypothetical protein
MNAHIALGRRVLRGPVIGLAIAALSLGALSAGALAADPSPDPASVASPGSEMTEPTELCQSASDLRLIIGFLRETSISEDGVIPVVVGVIAGLSEAQTLVGLVDETYRPLVEDFVISLQELRTTVDELGEAATLGAEIASIGEAITEIGTAMDALSVQLQTPCPVEDPADSSAGE